MAKRRFAGGVILCLALSSAIADTPTTAIIGTPPQPSWSNLNLQQKDALAPLAKDWDKLENIRKKKWLGIAERYPSMNQEEQLRVQERMREWANLTPDQRTKARSSYRDFNQLPPQQKQVVKQKWEAYTNLPPDEKQRARETGKSSKLLNPDTKAPLTPAERSTAETSSNSTPSDTKRQ